jgi:hypothetical protein
MLEVKDATQPDLILVGEQVVELLELNKDVNITKVAE